MHKQWQAVKRLLILCFEEMEAVLQLQGVVRSLHQGFPLADITLLTIHESQIIQAHLPWIEVSSLNEWITANEPQHSLMSHQDSYQSHAFTQHSLPLIEAMRSRQFDAAIIFTTQAQSPFSLAYLCYLAGIPLRLGQSREFGGGVLSHPVQPPIDPCSTAEYYLHLVKAIGIEAAIAPAELSSPHSPLCSEPTLSPR